MAKQIYYASLFCNVGIGETYLRKEGFVCKVANDKIQKRANWFQEAFPDAAVVCGDIDDPEIFNKLVALYKKHGCSMVACSCPCQDASLANNRRNPSSKRGMLFMAGLDFVRATRPNCVMMENVEQYLVVKPDVLCGQTVGEYIRAELEAMGYHVEIQVQDSANFSTPQHRRRAIILASRIGVWKHPSPHKKQITVRDAIGMLPSKEVGEVSDDIRHRVPYMAPAQVDVIRHTPTGCSAHDNPAPWKPCKVDGSPSKAQFKCAFQRKEWDGPSNTILCDSKGVSGFRTLHPGRKLPDGTYSDARALTIFELQRLSGLPDDWYIPDWASETLIRTVIGEQFAPLHVLAIMKTMPRPESRFKKWLKKFRK